MVQRRNGAGLAVEALFGLRVFRQMGGKNFDGDGAVERASSARYTSPIPPAPMGD
jgi:hypothetical protein